MSLDKLGAIAGYASQVSSDTDDKGFGRWLWLSIRSCSGKTDL